MGKNSFRLSIIVAIFILIASQYIPFSYSSNEHVFSETNSEEALVSSRASNYIKVTYPNGGEELAPGSYYSITWDSNYEGNVSVVLMRDNSYGYTISSKTPNDGHYLWKVPVNHIFHTTCAIHVYDIDNENVQDTSDGFFSIKKPDTMKITRPDYILTRYRSGTSLDIWWESSINGNIAIELYWSDPGNIFDTTITSSTENDGRFSWAIPIDQMEGKYRIKIFDVNNPDINDYSQPFRIYWLDSDDDGVPDVLDAFPNNKYISTDTDGDGFADDWNEDFYIPDDIEYQLDAFPNDSLEWFDTDNDGKGDNSDTFPYVHKDFLYSKPMIIFCVFYILGFLYLLFFWKQLDNNIVKQKNKLKSFEKKPE